MQLWFVRYVASGPIGRWIIDQEQPAGCGKRRGSWVVLSASRGSRGCTGCGRVKHILWRTSWGSHRARNRKSKTAQYGGDVRYPPYCRRGFSMTVTCTAWPPAGPPFSAFRTAVGAVGSLLGCRPPMDGRRNHEFFIGGIGEGRGDPAAAPIARETPCGGAHPGRCESQRT